MSGATAQQANICNFLKQMLITASHLHKILIKRKASDRGLYVVGREKRTSSSLALHSTSVLPQRELPLKQNTYKTPRNQKISQMSIGYENTCLILPYSYSLELQSQILDPWLPCLISMTLHKLLYPSGFCKMRIIIICLYCISKNKIQCLLRTQAYVLSTLHKRLSIH